jgi:hypothetical protein
VDDAAAVAFCRQPDAGPGCVIRSNLVGKIGLGHARMVAEDAGIPYGKIHAFCIQPQPDAVVIVYNHPFRQKILYKPKL